MAMFLEASAAHVFGPSAFSPNPRIAGTRLRRWVADKWSGCCFLHEINRLSGFDGRCILLRIPAMFDRPHGRQVDHRARRSPPCRARARGVGSICRRHGRRVEEPPMTHPQAASPETAAASEVRAGAPGRSVRMAVPAVHVVDVSIPRFSAPRAVPAGASSFSGRPLASRESSASLPPFRSSRRDFTLSSQEDSHV